MKKRTVYILCGVVFLAAAAVCGVKIFQSTYAPKNVRTETFRRESTEASARSESPAFEPVNVSMLSASVTDNVMPEEPEPEAAPYVSPIDFEALQELNPDIYAWLEIDNTDISYPIVQDPDNDEFYLDHNSDRDYSANGAIFSEATYNSDDLSEPVTILYGHHMKSGAMFGNLQQLYSDDEFLSENPTITVYTPEAELTYGVFAAIPYSGEHILYNHDFTDEYVFEGFFDEILNTRDLSAKINEEYAPEPGDQVLILSTCLIGNNTNRFLVMGTLLTDDQ